ncbi:MAG: WD40 repeat domain-containing protein, partial [Chloroflexi bacterium]
LAAAAEQALSNSNPDLALALALQSVEIDNPPPLAHRALADVTYGPGTRYLLEGHDAFISVVAYSPDGETMLSAGGDGSLCLWDAEDGSMIRCESAHEGVVTGAVYLENGEQYLTVSEDGTMRRWATESGELLQQYDFESAGLEFQIDEEGNAALVRSADGEVLLSSASANSGTLERYSFAGGFEGGLLSVAVDEEHGRVLTGVAGGLILLWDLDTGQVIREYDAHTDDTVSVDFSPDGRLFASASDDETAMVWEVEKDQPLAVLEGHRSRLLTVRFSPDGLALATGSWDTTAILWDMRTFEEIRKFEGHTGGVTHIEFLPEKQAILTSSWDNSLRLWNIVTGAVLREFNGHTGGVNALAISPDRSVAIS